ncbi:hypothetical protein [Sphingomonas baiyangensis]|uniref:hypothetical protein n=1 Tax=Sphingomonas baiyangensis TaxID=2572576 RepID=UPI001469C093|nr:hypothetical protein [Sphingomonas baiyangensis]
MRTGTFLFALYAMGITGLFMLATAYAWSPFADTGRSGPRPAGVFIGPTHK